MSEFDNGITQFSKNLNTHNLYIGTSRFTLIILVLFAFLIPFSGCKKENNEEPTGDFQLLRTTVGSKLLSLSQSNTNVVVDGSFEIDFSSSVDTTLAKTGVSIVQNESNVAVALQFTFSNDARSIIATPVAQLDWNSSYRLILGETLKSRTGVPFPGVTYTFSTENGSLEMIAATVNGLNLRTSSAVRGVQFDEMEFVFEFSEPLNSGNFMQYFSVTPQVGINGTLSSDGKSVTLQSTSEADYYTNHTVFVNAGLTSTQGFEFDGFNKSFQTGLDPRPKFDEISDVALMDKVQAATFKYFWDFAHPVSGLARERNSSGETVTIGGSGFGLMAILVGIERGFITRTQGIERLQKIVTFLDKADRFHGVWPHWMNGSTGRTIAFSSNDNGADLVETSFMAQGLITVRQYLNTENGDESALRDDINSLLDAIEWDWFTRDGQNVLYWHWSPDKGWAMNMQIRGYNEALITYVMAATSTDHRIDAEVYHNGWANNGNIRNGRSFYGIELPVGFDFGGPLFFAHYSFLGLDPRNLQDRYANYMTQNRNHSLINRAHSIANPRNFVGYSENSWGLTASDDHTGYGVHEPTRDNGTITPTAALSSMPYTPDESMQAMRFFYHVLGDKIWGEYGFYDAFNPTQSWWGRSYLAIDQGPIIIMIENHRSGLLWDLFMSAPEVSEAMDHLDFDY